MVKKVLITRPRDQADEFAAAVAACGAQPFFAPLLNIQKISYRINALPNIAALVITSRNAVPDVFPAIWVHLPIYCVGEGAAALCCRNGAQGDIIVERDIAHLLPQLVDAPSHSFLYLRGADISENIGAHLPYKEWHEAITYRADIVPTFPADILEAFPSLDIVTFFSGRTAEAFSAIVNQASLTGHLSHMTVLSLSDKGLDSVRHLGWSQVVVAPTPDMNGMVQALKRLTG